MNSDGVSAGASGRLSGIPGLVGSVALGAVVGGAVAWAGAGFVSGLVSPGVAVALGAALGGGLGSVVSLVGSEEATAGEESVTVEMDDGTPEPRPADLFEDHPDPLLYYTDSGAGPVVRAANAAFEEAFGVPAASVSDAALADALMVAEGSDDIVDAVASDAPLDRVVTCETPDGTERYRLQRIGSGADGYVRYLPQNGRQDVQ